MVCEENWGTDLTFNNPKRMYSFDASSIYDTTKIWHSISGSHGDLRSKNKITKCMGKGKDLSKITGTFNFVLKFIDGGKKICIDRNNKKCD